MTIAMMNDKITSMASLKNGLEETLASENITMVIGDIGTNSDNTITSYTKAMEEFIKFTFDENIGSITWSQLEQVNYEMALRFRTYLLESRDINDRRKKRLHPRSVNHMIFALSSIFKKLHKVNSNLNTSAFELQTLKFDDSEGSYGSLTEGEVERLLEYCLKLPEHQKPVVKSLFFETAYITAIRSGALMDLTWKGIKKVKDTSDEDVYYNVIKLQDKGGNLEVAISDELYNKLLMMKEVNEELGLKEDRVFPITRKTLSKCLKEFCEADGIDEDRNIVLHSLKKASIDKVYKESGDINLTARHGHHKGVEMVYRHYQGKNDGLANSPSLNLFNGTKRDLGELEGLTKEELLRVISNCNGLTIDTLLRSYKEIDSKS